jgi:kynurenine formamidase
MCSPEIVDPGGTSTRRQALAATAAGAVGLAALGTPARASGRSRVRFSEVRDLTHVVSPTFPVLPFYPALRERDLFTVAQVGAAAKELTMAEHTGTHIDAPSHFAEDGRTVERLTADELVAPLIVIRIGDRAERDPESELTVADVRAHERRYGRIPAGALVAMDSGWSKRLGRPGAYLNRGEDGTLRFPGFSAAAARLLVGGRRAAGLAVDTLSLDPGTSTRFPAHRVALSADRYVVENLAGLHAVPERGATAVVGASKHRGGTGGPARIFALL